MADAILTSEADTLNPLLELAKRVEAARAPDPRLGAEVEIAFRGFPERAYQQRNGMRAKGSPPLDRLDFMVGWMAADPTSSMDAAMTLAGNDGSGRTMAKLLAEAINRLGSWPVHLMAPIEFREAFARHFTAACLRARAADTP